MADLVCEWCFGEVLGEISRRTSEQKANKSKGKERVERRKAKRGIQLNPIQSIESRQHQQHIQLHNIEKQQPQEKYTVRTIESRIRSITGRSVAGQILTYTHSPSVSTLIEDKDTQPFPYRIASTLLLSFLSLLSFRPSPPPW